MMTVALAVGMVPQPPPPVTCQMGSENLPLAVAVYVHCAAARVGMQAQSVSNRVLNVRRFFITVIF